MSKYIKKILDSQNPFLSSKKFLNIFIFLLKDCTCFYFLQEDKIYLTCSYSRNIFHWHGDGTP